LNQISHEMMMQQRLDYTLLIDQKQGQSTNFIKQLTVQCKSTNENIKSVQCKSTDENTGNSAEFRIYILNQKQHERLIKIDSNE